MSSSSKGKTDMNRRQFLVASAAECSPPPQVQPQLAMAAEDRAEYL